MKATLISIGNSRGIRIPKPLIEQCGFTKEVDLEVRDHAIVIRSTHRPRENWDNSFSAMSHAGDDSLLDKTLKNRFDDEEWEWK